MTLLLEPRHVWKQRAVELGVTVAFGGALPPGRRLVVRLSDGKVRGDADESARWRGRVLIRETPADLSVAARAEVHAVAQRMAPPVGDFELEIVWDGEVAPGQEVALAAGARLATVTAHAGTRAAALTQLRERLATLRLSGLLTDLARLCAALPVIAAGLTTARDLEVLSAAAPAVEVIAPGLLTTVQDWPGRPGTMACSHGSRRRCTSGSSSSTT